MHMFHYVMKGI